LSRGNRSQSSRERSEEERERDREERERRRAARAGGRKDDTGELELPAGEPSPVVPAPPEIPASDAHLPHLDPSTADAEPHPAETSTADAEPHPAETPTADAEPHPAEIAKAAEQPLSGELGGPAAPAAGLSSEESTPAQLPITETHAAEPSPGTPLAGQEPPEPPESPYPPQPAERRPAYVRPAGRSPARGRSLLARGGAFLALAAVIAVVWVLIDSLGGSGHARPAGGAAVVKVLIPEGETRLQIAQIAAADGLTGSYLAASRSSPVLNPAHYGAPPGTPDLEGFLFPATYEMNPGAPVAQLVSEQLAAFRQVFGAGMILRAQHLHTTAYRLLIIASMIEREAKTARDRPLIAAVIYNRLNQGIPLGIDATIYYALALRSGIGAYTRELTEAELHIDSPYNTRVHAGLPPTPISNPGMASIEAAAHPAHVPYLYYVLAADGCGEHVFSTSYAQFERNAAAYRAALAKNGGQPPACKA
jgi:cell division protein YceG involved in septum cleavage